MPIGGAFGDPSILNFCTTISAFTPSETQGREDATSWSLVRFEERIVSAAAVGGSFLHLRGQKEKEMVAAEANYVLHLLTGLKVLLL